MCNENAWTIPEPPPKPTPKKRGILFLSPEDMQEAKKSMQEKGIRSEDVKNLPPIEEIHGLDNPIQVVDVNSLCRFDESDINLLAYALMNLTTLLPNNRVSMIMLADIWNKVLVCLAI